MLICVEIFTQISSRMNQIVVVTGGNGVFYSSKLCHSSRLTFRTQFEHDSAFQDVSMSISIFSTSRCEFLYRQCCTVTTVPISDLINVTRACWSGTFTVYTHRVFYVSNTITRKHAWWMYRSLVYTSLYRTQLHCIIYRRYTWRMYTMSARSYIILFSYRAE